MGGISSTGYHAGGTGHQGSTEPQRGREFRPISNFVRCVEFSRDGANALTGSGMTWSHEERKLVAGTDNTIRLWDLATGDEIRRFTGHGNWRSALPALGFSPAAADTSKKTGNGRQGRIPASGSGTCGRGRRFAGFRPMTPRCEAWRSRPTAASLSQAATTGSSGCGGSRSDDPFCE